MSIRCRYFLHDNHLTRVFDTESTFVSMRAAKRKARQRAREHLANLGLEHYKIGPWAEEVGHHRAIVRDPSQFIWVGRDENIRYTLVVQEVLR